MAVLLLPLPIDLLQDLVEALVVLTRVPPKKLVEGQAGINFIGLVGIISKMVAFGGVGRGGVGSEGGGGESRGLGAELGGGGGLIRIRVFGGAALLDLELGVADEDGVAGADGLQPVEAVAELGDVGEEVALDDILDGGDVRVLIEDGGAALSRVGVWDGGGGRGG